MFERNRVLLLAGVNVLCSLWFFPVVQGFAASFASAYGSNNGNDSRRTAARTFVELNNPVDTSLIQQLPASMIQHWPTWVLGVSGDLIKIPDGTDQDGFVAPGSIDELWQPIDLQPPELRLALGLHM